MPTSVWSRIRPANDRETSRNDGNGWSTESAGQETDSGIAGCSETRLENILKVETRVRTPLGLLPGRATARWPLGRQGPKWGSPDLSLTWPS